MTKQGPLLGARCYEPNEPAEPRNRLDAVVQEKGTERKEDRKSVSKNEISVKKKEAESGWGVLLLG